MIEIAIGAIGIIFAVSITHLQSGWAHSRSIPYYLLKLCGTIDADHLNRFDNIDFDKQSQPNGSETNVKTNNVQYKLYFSTNVWISLFLQTFDNCNQIDERNKFDEKLIIELWKCRQEIETIVRSIRIRTNQDELRTRWIIVCKRIDNILMIVFLFINTATFVILLLIGYLKR